MANSYLRANEFRAERGNKSVYSRKVSSFSVGLMKSLHGNDEIQDTPWIKSNPSK